MPNIRMFVPPVLTVIAGILVWVMVVERYQHLSDAKTLSDTQNYASTLSVALESELQKRFAVFSGFGRFVDYNLNDVGNVMDERMESRLSEFVRPQIQVTSGFRNFSVAPQGVQTWVFPLLGNEKSLGRDLLNDPRPIVRADVRRAIDTGKLVLSGPYQLPHGGLGLVARQAVFVGDEFWGLVAMVIDLPAIFEATGVDRKTSRYSVGLRSGDGNFLWGDKRAFSERSVMALITLPGGAWHLDVVPKLNPVKGLSFEALGFGFSFGAFILAMAAIVYFLANRQIFLENAIEKKNYEARATVRRFKDYAKSSSDWFWEMDEQLCFTYISQNKNKLSDYDPNVYLGKTREDTAAEDVDNDKWKRHADDLAQHRPFRNFNFNLKISETAHVMARVSGMPVFDQNGKFCGYRGTGTDITELKMAEAALLASEEQFRSAFENIAIANIIINEKGTIEIFNFAARDMFGYSAAEVIGQNINTLMPEPDQTKHDGYIRKYLSTGETSLIGQIREVTGLRKNGEEFQMHLAVGEMVIRDTRYFVGSISDLTEMKTLEAHLRQSQRMEAVGQLTGGIAHDFNNILGVMIGNAEMLSVGSEVGEKAKNHVEAIIQAIERASSLTNRLLSFSRQQKLSPVATDVSGLISNLEEMLTRTLGETIDLRAVRTSGLWPATIDPHQFENALINLTINARDAMPQGGKLTIETSNVTLDEDYSKKNGDIAVGDYVMVGVSDTGTGMTLEVQEKVFEPFFTTKDIGSGSGLGLSMVYGFVKQSSGHISVYSEPGHGTTFRLYMPRAEGVGSFEGIVVTAPIITQGSGRVLVVEDDAGLREIAVTILGGQGYDVVEAERGDVAINHLKSAVTFDLLFTDMVLPGGLNGVDIASEAVRLQPDIKVLYTSGYAENSIIHDGKLALGQTLLTKPYRRVELLEKIRAVLEPGEY